MVGLGGKGRNKGGGPGGGGGGFNGPGDGYPGQLVRPSSVGDFNEVDEGGWTISQMSDQEVLAEFDKMLENMNLSEVSKAAVPDVTTFGILLQKLSITK